MPQPLTLEWFGCTTFRVRVAGLTLFFDTYLDRPPSIPDVGLDFERGRLRRLRVHQPRALRPHARRRHDRNERRQRRSSARTRRPASCARTSVPAAQLLPVSGGETIDCGHDVRVRVFPSLHSCLFARSNPDSGAECIGDLGVSHQERTARIAAIFESMPSIAPDLATYLLSTDGHSSRVDGGQLNYLVETPDGSILVNASSGYWTGILRDLRPDVALIALAGRPNVDGEPHQGSLAQFLVGQVELLKPQKVAVLPSRPAAAAADCRESTPARRSRRSHAMPSYAQHVDLPYSEPVPILRARAKARASRCGSSNGRRYGGGSRWPARASCAAEGRRSTSAPDRRRSAGCRAHRRSRRRPR